MEVFIVILVVVVGVGTVAVLSSGGTSSFPGWNAAAQRLGLRYQHPDSMTGPIITGKRRGFQIRVDTHSKSSDQQRTYTRYRVSFKKSLGLGLRLVRQGPLSYISMKLGSKDIMTGDRDFDGAVTVKGRDPELMAEFLTSTRRRGTVRFLSLHPSGLIDDAGIECEDRDVTDSPDRIVQVVQRMTTLAEQFTAENEAPLDYFAAIPVPDKDASDANSIIIADLPKLAPISFPRLPETEIEPAHDTPTPLPIVDAPNASSEDESSEADTDMVTVTQALFSTCETTSETTELFRTKYEGKEVSWSGILANVRSYRFDLVFGNEPGTRAEFEILAAEDLKPGRRAVKAVVQFPAASEEELRALVDHHMAFRGFLIGCDAFLNTLFLTNGQIAEVDA